MIVQMPAPTASWMPIGELARRVGVSPDVLRKWESRYGVLSPARTAANRRVYSRVDEARALLMQRHVRRGVPAAQAAELAIAARFRITPGTATTTTIDQAHDARVEMQAALERYDETSAEQALERLFATFTATTVIRDVFLPYMHEVGERWADKRLNVAQEHFASTFVHGRLLALARGWDRGLGPRALLACAAGEQHTFGLIAFGVALHQVGWRVTYLGADTPVPTIQEAANFIDPAMIVVAAAIPGMLEPLASELSELAAGWPLALAGGGVDAELASECGAQHLQSDPISAAVEVSQPE